MMMRMRQRVLSGSAYIFLGMALSSCGVGSGEGVSKVAGVAASTADVVPSITGAPTMRVSAGTLYTFTPTAEDPNLDPLSFSIVNQPAWASFDTTTGTLSGIPGADAVGTTVGISIMVSDGTFSAALPPFDLTVSLGNSGIGNTQPAGYVWTVLEDGQFAFIDRDFVFGDIPTRYEGLEFLQTANDDMSLSTPDAVSFDVAVPVTVYVGYDSRISTLPAWLASWTNTGDRWDGPELQRDVYSKEFPASSVVLGGNEMGFSMYSVAVEYRGTSILATAGSPATSITAGDTYQFISLTSGTYNRGITFEIENMPAWANFDAEYGALWGKPGAADVGVYDNIIIYVNDGQTITPLHEFSIDVESGSTPPPSGTTNTTPPSQPSGTTNTAPWISGTPAASITQGAHYKFNPNAGDADGDALTFTIKNKPQWVQFDPWRGALWGQPGAADVGAYKNIVIRLSDGDKSVWLPAFSITVKSSSTTPPPSTPPPSTPPPPPPSEPTNTAPWISGTPAASITQGENYKFNPNANDPDGDALTFTIENKPQWVQFDPWRGALWGQPGAADVGVYDNIVINVSDGDKTARLPAFSITVKSSSTTTPPPPPPSGNKAPWIGGTPAASVTPGDDYRFIPNAGDPEGDTLTFTIKNKPAWASFLKQSGRISGAPGVGDVGAYDNIIISVSDGQTSVSLPAFRIDVVGVSSGSASVAWRAPTQKEDGTSLTGLAGYKIYYGSSPGNYSRSVTVSNPGITTYVINNLSGGTWYFAVTAHDSSGNESVKSSVVSKSIF